MRVLIVEDENKIAQFTSQTLKEHGFDVDLAQTAAKSREFFDSFDYDLVVLDLMLPDDDGLKLCKHFKTLKNRVPVIIVSTLSEIHDKVRGLDSGADDYMTKPFYVEELIARARAITRRNGDQGFTLSCDDLQIDLVKRTAKREGQMIKLTTKEFAILELFLRNTGKALTRNQIAQQVWDLHYDPESNIVDVYIKQLRKKIDQPNKKKLIKTIIGIGYVLNSD
jgi:two-component system, OmpR family, copper resistance phosphate regulon response regulator CusR